ncbi:toxic protein SymE [Trinickia symbiotica]|uniref:Type I addiction module toxin, SymE family n=1 Tax=Trinickia symbiotica TaxID=863227 RepID=A0A2N7X6T5_9BURK|nr:SymE family type I addiction module toxin [Trinickia symbiotica]PMS37466.1 type I addiction module toxin, SymE family [Trinickia symbiotica]PPK42751.1 toxic protein SymE [Trinickia symbiotica]
MADADLNARPAHLERHVTIQESWRYRQWESGRHYRTDPPLFPWFKVSGRWLEHAGVKPRQRLKIEVQHKRLVITPA